VLIIPEDVMFRQVNVMNRTLFYFSAVLLLLGVLFSAFIDKKFFQPVLSILHNLNTGRAEVTVAADLNDRAPDSKVKASEFVQIETYINTMISKNRDQEKQLESYFQYYRERIIQALMNNDRQAVEMLEDDRILFNRNYKYFSLILICSGVHEPDGTGTDQEQSAMEHFNCNLTGVLSGLGQLEKITITRQKTALLLCMESERTVCDIARHIRENLQNRLEASDISITVGCVCNSMRHIGKSYTNAEELMKYCHEEQGLHVIDGSMSGDVPGSRDYRCTEKTVMGIAEALKQQDSLRLEEHLGYFFEQMRVNGVSLKSMKKKCLVLIYRIFTEAGEDIRESKNELFLENIFDKLEGLRSVHGLEEWTKESFMNCIANPASTSDGINNRDLIDRVVKFIDLHYMEDIGLNTIADYVYFSPSYLGKVFKEVSGYNFSDYIIKVRMEKAAKLILDSNTKLTDIMEKVGYYSIQGFSRVFKSYFKCSPGEYRKKYACDVLKTENVR
jgi:AraC-like DNA-binding protein